MIQSFKTHLKFSCGHAMKNRFMLAPMTNQQSHDDGTLSEDEWRWLTMRAKGQFGLVMTCASHVQEIGKGFPGQLGIFSDDHIPGHKRLAASIKENGSLVVIQLHHAGMRSPVEVIGQAPVCPSGIEKYGCRALTATEVQELKEDFISAAVRAKASGYDGVEVHGAHGYILTQFLSGNINSRTDEYGGSLENRSRILIEIVNGIRKSCGEDFLLGVRLSPERFGMKLQEIKWLTQKLIDDGMVDFLDISLWDCFKFPEEEEFKDKPLLEHFTSIDFKDVRLTVAGKIRDGKDVMKIMDAGVDFVTIGRSAILHHDFPMKVMENPEFTSIQTPVSKSYLANEGLSNAFVDYMQRWPNFVEENS
jgi:2,4-dienoyl-CoA reductase-like NADH-dependent reductase (Old Yellow Enzyme family)